MRGMPFTVEVVLQLKILAHCSRSAFAQIKHVAMAMHAPTNEVAEDDFDDLNDFVHEQDIFGFASWHPPE